MNTERPTDFSSPDLTALDAQGRNGLNPTVAPEPNADRVTPEVGSKVLDAAAVLAASVKREKANTKTDLELLESLESTILRIDAPDNAWEKAAVAISKLASSRAESRMKTA